MVKPLRLQKYIADCGICSRREAETFIQAGRVLVNGNLAVLGQKVDSSDIVKIDDKVIQPQAGPKETYLVYKPIGYTSSTKDTHAELLVTSLIPSATRLYPVGRLDKNSEGLILLTNDGELAHISSHPKFILQKVYEVEINPSFRSSDSTYLAAGIQDGNDFLTLDKLEVITPTRLQITLHHGKKRHIRRMLAKAHYHVNKLTRIQIGPLTLASLNNKPYRLLTQQECSQLTS